MTKTWIDSRGSVACRDLAIVKSPKSRGVMVQASNANNNGVKSSDWDALLLRSEELVQQVRDTAETMSVGK